ncbi:hypothetical protein N7495_006732 [Penicillium taxi]|uniref:uncharacterized protein n=1 Tax=Penicillium taxi TaxID=168475 RepID=UPI0025458BF3|nr:uncharacterized protein N7495_006732 [Penicillium taxi]KAJ5895041.1 hypothetical protein N7495_006732 [Penicillium taxi]
MLLCPNAFMDMFLSFGLALHKSHTRVDYIEGPAKLKGPSLHDEQFASTTLYSSPTSDYIFGFSEAYIPPGR